MNWQLHDQNLTFAVIQIAVMISALIFLTTLVKGVMPDVWKDRQDFRIGVRILNAALIVFAVVYAYSKVKTYAPRNTLKNTIEYRSKPQTGELKNIAPERMTDAERIEYLKKLRENSAPIE